MVRALVAVAIVIALVRGAHAEPRVVIVETSDAPKLESLATQVRVYAGERVTVTSLARPETSAIFAEVAVEIVATEAATAVVWVSQLADGQGYLVYAAGRWPGRALIELVRVPAPTPVEEAERTIALKIAALLDSLLVQHETTATVLGLPPAPVVAPAVVVTPPPIAAPWSLALGGALVVEGGDRAWDGRVALRLGYRRGNIGAWGGVYWQPASDIGGIGGRVVVQELGLRAGAAVERDIGRWRMAIGPHVTFGAQHARGLGTDGSAATATVIVPALGANVGGSWAWSKTLRVFMTLEPELALIRQRFLIDGVPTADLALGRFAVSTGIATEL